MKTLFLCKIVLLYVVALPAAWSAVYKCLDASGATVYSGSPCQQSQESRALKLKRSGSVNNSNTCLKVGEFADQVALSMQYGQSIARVIRAYGGQQRLSDPGLQIINSVYAYQGRQNNYAHRISESIIDKCNAGHFGKISYSDIPAQLSNNVAASVPLAETQGQNSSAKAPEKAIAVVAQSNSDTDTMCNSYWHKIKEIDKRLADSDATQQSALSKEKRRYRILFRANCR